ncbi:MAG: hypothetical protein A3A32_00360 [Candidatus Wildermuthbacteria bacterium RIFCSPLOWO2_01_FULL_48_35]|uniref:Uncharacterized protein n=2 Tax=Candidatus Wildermuthiibacteriota TaxID=1817923 RepID=A0A1G2RMQ3_9BACT|nr:MAG: hypothetical protein A3D59_03895 [Candidatus Wildermuthbacteria bacterium RIFCSPHIGHO2_02_FULL_47_17]OHA74133.1 MAG: hypothetical protein A3A32_00360 [Candidatus Wildermuthbacteria bacterium RIFCSPLOWO2_01_FULL_48_35]
MNRKKIFLLCFAASVIALVLWAQFGFAQPLEVAYPKVPGSEPVSALKTLPEFVKYAFVFAIALAGFIIFASFLYGGMRYLTSVGNPSAMSDAKSKILEGILGVILLLAAFWLLNTINPQLVQLQFSADSARKGIVLCASGACSANPTGTQGTDFIKLKGSVSCIRGTADVRCEYPQMKPVSSVYFANSSDELEVNIFGNRDFQPEPPSWSSKNQPYIDYGAILSVPNGESVELIWKQPGVYLFAEEKCQGEAHFFANSSASFDNINFHDKTKSLKIIPSVRRKETNLEKLLAAIPGPGGATVVTEKLGVILHERNNYEYDATVWMGGDGPPMDFPYEPPDHGCINVASTGSCDDQFKEPYCIDNSSKSASSLTVFKQVINFGPPEEMGEGVTVFGNFQWNEQDKDDRSGDQQIHCGPISAVTEDRDLPPGRRLETGSPLWVDGRIEIGESVLYDGTENRSERDCAKLFGGASNPFRRLPTKTMVSSIKIAGNYIAVLFRPDGRGEVFGLPERAPNGDYNLKQGNHIGNDQATAMLVIPVESK